MDIEKGLDKAGVSMIELSHGDGIAGFSINYGMSAVSEMELLKVASQVAKYMAKMSDNYIL